MPYRKLDTKQKNPKSYRRKTSKNKEGDTPRLPLELLKLLNDYYDSLKEYTLKGKADQIR